MKQRLYDFIPVKHLCVGMSLCGIVAGTQTAQASPVFGQSSGLELPSPSIYQQSTKQISGIVKDQAGIPVIGANVIVKGTTNGVITGLDGDFLLEVPENATLEISYIGYMTQSIPINGKTTFNIILEEDTQKLDEVVVLGYGAGQRKQDLSASVGVLNNTEDLVARPVTSTESMLQGQLAGVTVQANGGDPTATPSIVIRGQGSQNGDNVLWVVDGVPGAPIASMNDIETIVVLKDAASAAIYGAQSGAGGVILVTTKKAKEGKTSLSYDATFGVRKASNVIEPLNAEEQLEMRKLSYANAGLTLPTGWDLTKNPWVGTTRTNWMDEIFRTAFYQRHNVALNVGSENASNRVSFAYDNDEGVLINTFNKNLSLRYNGKFKLNKWVTITEDVVWKNNESRSKDTDSGYTGVVAAAMYMPASATVYNPLDGTYGGTTTEDPDYIAKYGSNFADIHGDAVNPVRLLEAENRYDRTSDIWSTTSLELANIVTGLKFTSRFTYNLKNNLYKNFSPIRDEVGKPSLTNNLDETTYRADAWKTENTLTYDNTFNDMHTVGVLLSTTADHYSKRGLEVNGKDLSDESDYLQYLSYANSVSATDYLTGPDANVSLIARLAYSFNDRYFVTASWRRDYAGRLPKDNNYGDFPAVTAGWKISNESFFPKSETLNLLKIRASWGQLGNQNIGLYPYQAMISGVDDYPFTKTSDGVIIGYQQTAYANRNIKWETTTITDIGFDLQVFDGLSVTFDWYKKTTDDILRSSQVSSLLGLSAPTVNNGSVENKGIEVALNYANMVKGGTFRGFRYNAGGYFDRSRNKLTEFGAEEIGSYSIKREGLPYDEYYMLECIGVFADQAEINASPKQFNDNTQPGDLKYKDISGPDGKPDGVIDNYDRRTFSGRFPGFEYGINASATWKGFDLSLIGQGVADKKYYTTDWGVQPFMQGSSPNKDYIKHMWTEENPYGAKHPKLYWQDMGGGKNTRPNSYYLKDASFFRLKNLTLGYTLPRVWTEKANISKVRIYFSGDKLLTLTPYKGLDPERNGDGRDAIYPQNRIYSFGLNVEF